jgi:hypothetical protein
MKVWISNNEMRRGPPSKVRRKGDGAPGDFTLDVTLRFCIDSGLKCAGHDVASHAFWGETIIKKNPYWN